MPFLSGPEGKVDIYALFDGASTITMIDAKLADEIGTSRSFETLKIKWTNSMTSEEYDSKTVNLRIRGQNEETAYYLKNCQKSVSSSAVSSCEKNFEKVQLSTKKLNIIFGQCSTTNPHWAG
ncbi:hypothetical protein JTB14_034066 [Gonioctena quinquepunctata]|nr:hypothetical protein JTB14_034066 [Gonioctena quinquepunctata]